jgi:ParB family chromosome partitioning protein
MAAQAQKNRLGRGLASLMGDLEADAAVPERVHGYQALAIGDLDPNPVNPRVAFNESELDELAASIREKGVVQPILARPSKNEGRFEIVAGERRWRAAQRAGLHVVPVVVRVLSDKEALELAIIENVQRSDLNAIEEARGYRQLIDRYKHTQNNLAGVVGKSRSHLANTLRLLKLPDPVQKLVEDGKLSAGHARALIGRSDAEELALQIVKDGLNVRDVEDLVKAPAKPGARSTSRRSVADADTRAAETELAEALGLKVSIRPGSGESGEVRIKYRTLDQFEDIRRRILGEKS